MDKVLMKLSTIYATMNKKLCYGVHKKGSYAYRLKIKINGFYFDHYYPLS